MKFLTLPLLTKKEKKYRTPEKLSLVILVTNYHKLSCYHLWSDPDENQKKNRC